LQQRLGIVVFAASNVNRVPLAARNLAQRLRRAMVSRTGRIGHVLRGLAVWPFHRWGNAPFNVARYRTTATENWAESRGSGQGETLEISDPLPPPGIELIAIQRQ
jgi:hypothetical protein